MGAVGAHGWLAGDAATGIVGAVVSGLAKGTWTILLAYQSVPLDKRTAAFLEQELGEAGAELARIPVDRRVQRARALRDAERRALTADTVAAPTEAENVIEPPAPTSGAHGTPVSDLRSLWGAHGPIVYFLGNGSRVKIGTTKNLPGRLSALCLPPESLLCAFHGGHDIERRFHSMFAEHRVPKSEWFDRTGALAEFIAAQTGDAPHDAGGASGDADAADDDARDVRQALPPLPPLPAGASKTALILAASSTLQPGAAPAAIAHLLAQHGHAVDTAYIRTVLSRAAAKDDEVGKGGGGYA
ncbi:GIY-YIG nuclease family protein [Streptomyces sp. KL116D]|uniref:GIY-YIG nuclease family protein n=1 Tax=Streptomyces sp. KL116D TaxID=3045152 RepID=UPI003557ACA2